MNITMPRGDIQNIIFTITWPPESEQEITPTEIYFTVKQSYGHKDYLFQKRLTTGQIEYMSENTYGFTIEAADTDMLSFGKYVFDIEIVGEGLKQTTVGDFVLTHEVTYASNED